MEEIRSAAYDPAGIAGRRGEFATFSVDMRKLALLQKRALGSLERKLGYPHDWLRLRKLGAEVPFKDTVAGRSVSSVASFDFGSARPAPRGATQSAS